MFNKIQYNTIAERINREERKRRRKKKSRAEKIGTLDMFNKIQLYNTIAERINRDETGREEIRTGQE